MREAIGNIGNRLDSNGHVSFFDPVWKLLDGVLAAAQNRLELFQVEVQEEKARLTEILLLVSALMILGTLALSVATFAILFIVWQTGLLLLLPCVIAAYAAGAYMAWRALQTRLNRNVPFDASAQELKEDRECISRRL